MSPPPPQPTRSDALTKDLAKVANRTTLPYRPSEYNMSPGFVTSPCYPQLESARHPFPGCLCTRRLSSRPAPYLKRSASRNPCMMAKFQQKSEESNSSLENESQLEKILPPPALPTLTTLTDDPEIDLSAISTAPTTAEGPLSEEQDVSNMGAGLSATQETDVVAFLKGVVEEFKEIEWPSFKRVVRLSVLILVTVILATTGLYFIDGFFYRVSQVLFEGAT